MWFAREKTNWQRASFELFRNQGLSSLRTGSVIGPPLRMPNSTKIAKYVDKIAPKKKNLGKDECILHQKKASWDASCGFVHVYQFRNQQDFCGL